MGVRAAEGTVEPASLELQRAYRPAIVSDRCVELERTINDRADNRNPRTRSRAGNIAGKRPAPHPNQRQSHYNVAQNLGVYSFSPLELNPVAVLD